MPSFIYDMLYPTTMYALQSPTNSATVPYLERNCHHVGIGAHTVMVPCWCAPVPVRSAELATCVLPAPRQSAEGDSGKEDEGGDADPHVVGLDDEAAAGAEAVGAELLAVGRLTVLGHSIA